MADKSGYIGRSPGDSAVIIANQTFEPSGVQTNFTFASGYDPGYVEAYLNGVKLIYAVDFVATDGSTVGLTSFANNGDVLEVVAYKAFNLGNPVTEATGDFSVGNQLSIVGLTTGADAFFSGVVTATSFSGDGSQLTGVAGGKFSSNDTGIHTTSSVGIGTTNATGAADSNNTTIINAGIVTANFFHGDGSNLTGLANTDFINATQLNVIGVTTSSSAIVGSAVTINSTGIDAISGIITANKFVGNGSLLTNVGISTEFVTADQLTVTGVTTSSAVIVGSAVTINSTGIDAVSGVITASSFVGNVTGTAGGLSGTPDITVRNITGVAATFTGVLTYEDVTNVDSIGVVTARSGVNVSGGQLLVGSGVTIGNAGVATFSGTSDVHLVNNVQLNFGDGREGDIYRDSAQMIINNDGGNLKVRSASVHIAGLSNEKHIVSNTGVGVTLFYNNSSKLETTNDGTVTTGIATATAIDAGIALWVLGANGSSHYTFTGPGNLNAADDPQIELQRGQKYVFRNNSGGGHPFQIRVSNGGSAYSTGVTNNGASSGDIVFDVPYDAPNQLYYQCTNHSSMGGVILIGERAIPARDETSQATLTADDAGKVVSTTTGGWIVPTGVLDAGDAVTLINKSGSDQTITCSALTMYNSADGSTVTSRTLGGRGVCTIWFESSSVAYISGAGLS